MRVAIVGLGLIGGSLALASGARGYDADPEVRAAARKRGIDVTERLEDALSEAEVVVAAVPPAALVDVLVASARAAPTATLTDVASSQRDAETLASALREGVRFVGGHPIAGSTRHGLAAADRGLFRGRPWLLVPTSRSDPGAMALVGDLARRTGARPLVVAAERHEELMTALSRLPLLVAAALTRMAAAPVERTGGDDDADPTERVAKILASVAGPGFLDTTRLAATPEDLALELVLADPEALAVAVEEIAHELGSLPPVLRAREEAALRSWLGASRGVRLQLDAARDESAAK